MLGPHGKKLESVGLDARDDDHKIEYTQDTLEEELSQADLKIVSDFMPTIPIFPWNGIIAMSAFFSPKLYKKLQSKKREYVNSNQKESIGWVVIVK